MKQEHQTLIFQFQGGRGGSCRLQISNIFLIYFPPWNSFRTFMYCDLWISKLTKEQFSQKLYEKIRYVNCNAFDAKLLVPSGLYINELYNCGHTNTWYHSLGTLDCDFGLVIRISSYTMLYQSQIFSHYLAHDQRYQLFCSFFSVFSPNST